MICFLVTEEVEICKQNYIGTRMCAGVEESGVPIPREDDGGFVGYFQHCWCLLRPIVFNTTVAKFYLTRWNILIETWGDLDSCRSSKDLVWVHVTDRNSGPYTGDVNFDMSDRWTLTGD